MNVFRKIPSLPNCFSPSTVIFDDLTQSIGKQGKIKRVLSFEFLVRFGVVLADTYNLCAKFRQIISSVSQTARLNRTAWSIIFWIKIKHYPFASIVRQLMLCTVAVRKRKVWGWIWHVFHSIYYTRFGSPNKQICYNDT